MILRRINRLLGFTSWNRSTSLTRCITAAFLLVVAFVHIQIQVTGNLIWSDNRAGDSGRETAGEREEFAWYGVHEGKEDDNELVYIDETNADDERPIPPPVDLGGPHRLILGKKNLLSADDSFDKAASPFEEDVAQTVKVVGVVGLTVERNHSQESDGNVIFVTGDRDSDVSSVGLKLQPWASPEHSLDAEATRLFKYITTPQKECKPSKFVGCSGNVCPNNWPLNICFHEIHKKQRCIVYSFRTNFPTLDFENEMADAGCEVHVFDPTLRSTRFEPALTGNNLQRDVQRNVVFHRITLDWRETASELDLFGPPTLRAKNLRTVMSELGHNKIEVLRIDLESSEWKILENLLIDRWINRINQIILNVHLHWSGFEVSGSKPEVVRFWYSVLFGLESSNFYLFNSVANTNAPQIFLGEVGKFNASSSYTLGFMKNF